jgi:Domain of unknown function (DUF4864)
MMNAPEDNLFSAPGPEFPENGAPEQQNESAGRSQGRGELQGEVRDENLGEPPAAAIISQTSGPPEINARYEALAARRETEVHAHVAGSHVPSRRATLMALGFAVASLLTWTALQREGFFDATGPREIVRAQVDDLGRGQLRAAYDLFSPRYRQQVPFNEWRELVVTHWRVFRTRELRFGDNEQSNGRAVLETHLLAESGDRYVARFTLVRAEGRWWVDDLRWSQETDERGRVST